MRREVMQCLLFAMVMTVLYSCRKDAVTEQPPPVSQPGETITVKMQGVITIGSILYDSIPAMFRITSWDAANVAHQKDTLLSPGKNSIRLPKDHIRYQFVMSKWGIADTMNLKREDLQENLTYTLGGAKAAKKLLREEQYTAAAGDYTPLGKTVYSYNSKGLSLVEVYQKLPASANMQLIEKQHYQYNGDIVSRIDVSDGSNAATGFTTFNYNPQLTKIVDMHKTSNTGEIAAAVEYRYPAGHAMITINYRYSNGNAMEYRMKIIGGNNVADTATSSHSGVERGEYRYDLNINPYAHMNMPDLFLSNLSKNNLTDQQKVYVGSYPDNEPYKFEYTYDSEGYPVELVKYYKNHKTGEYLFKIKTLYFY